MATNDSSSGLPPILTPSKPPTRQPPTGNLQKALVAVLGRTNWDGVPTQDVLATAIRTVLAMEDSPSQGRKMRILLEALGDAIEDRTVDKFGLTLKGIQGYEGKTFAKENRERNIGSFVAERILGGIKHDSALGDAKTKFDGIGRTKANEFYVAHKQEVKHFSIIIRELRDTLSNRLAALRARSGDGSRE